MTPAQNHGAPLVAIAQVTKTYAISATNQTCVLRGIDLEIRAGEFVSIMGPSGSGKSTLLNLISALDTASSGSIFIEGQDISLLTDDQLTVFRRNKIGLVFQFFNLLPTLNAVGNVLLPILLERRATAKDQARAAQLLEDVGLKERAHHKIQQLSGGELQRVAIARALIQQPRLLLADEPTGNLDSKIGAGILTLLRETCERLKMTIIMVTHDRGAADYGHRLVCLKDGIIVSDEAIAASSAAGSH